MHEGIKTESGGDDARRDIAAGRLRYFYGTRGGWAQFCHDLMRSRFGIEIESTSCFVTAELNTYREEYNSIIADHIDKVFGQGALEGAWQEVRRFREQHYAAQQHRQS